MPKFATQKVESINAKEIVEELVIDGKSQIESLEELLAGTTFLGELSTILRYVEYVADGGKLPDTKFHYWELSGKEALGYVFKSKHVRLYGIQQPNKKLIICGGQKSTQDDDKTTFDKLATAYINTTNIKSNDKKRASKK